MIRVTAAQRHDLQGQPNQFYIETEAAGGEHFISFTFDTSYKSLSTFSKHLREMGDQLDQAAARRVNRSQELEA